VAKQRREFDPERLVIPSKSGRTMTYETPNKVWFLKIILRQLPGGLFTSGEVWHSHSTKTRGIVTVHRSAWNYGVVNDDQMQWSTARLPPDYVKYIAVRMGEFLHNKFPLRGSARREVNAMNYWEQFGDQSQVFWDGVKVGVTAYAYYKDGTQHVGTTGNTLKNAHEEIDAIAAKTPAQLGPFSRAARNFLERQGQLPDDPQEQLKAISRIVKFMEDNSTNWLQQHKEVLLK